MLSTAIPKTGAPPELANSKSKAATQLSLSAFLFLAVPYFLNGV
jgi:hypothetical protein